MERNFRSGVEFDEFDQGRGEGECGRAAAGLSHLRVKFGEVGIFGECFGREFRGRSTRSWQWGRRER